MRSSTLTDYLIRPHPRRSTVYVRIAAQNNRLRIGVSQPFGSRAGSKAAIYASNMLLWHMFSVLPHRFSNAVLVKRSLRSPASGDKRSKLRDWARCDVQPIDAVGL